MMPQLFLNLAAVTLVAGSSVAHADELTKEFFGHMKSWLRTRFMKD